MILRTAAILFGILLALFLGEALVRILALRPQRVAFPRYLGWDGNQWIEDGTWGRGTIKRPSPYPEIDEMGEYVPGATFRIIYASNPRGYFDPDGGVPVHINSAGLRGREVSVQKDPGVFRILGLGDSFTLGVGVRDDDTYLHRLEVLLNEERQGGIRYEVLNAGIGGYNTRDEIVLLERRLLGFDPDLVLIGFFLNDAYSERTFDTQGRALGLYLEPSPPARISHLWDLIEHRWRSRHLAQGIDTFYRSRYFRDAPQFLQQPGEKTVDWSTARAALARAAALARERKFRIALVIFPQFYRLDGRYPFETIHRFVGEECRSLGIPALDLLETYRGRRDEDLWVHISDHHPNEVAHRLAAAAIARFITDPKNGLGVR